MVIDDATYFVGANANVHRDDGKILCESMNMTLISFESDAQKWRSVNTWLSDNGTMHISKILKMPNKRLHS